MLIFQSRKDEHHGTCFVMHKTQVLNDGIVKADNSYLYDCSGRRYVDLEAGEWRLHWGIIIRAS